MNFKRSITLVILIAMFASLFRTSPVLASPPAPDDEPVPNTQGTDIVGSSKQTTSVKPIDQPNIKDVQRIREREKAMESGEYMDLQVDEVETDRVLVVLVEFAGTDTFTWTQGTSTWDPLGKADPAELGPGGAGDCSLIVPVSDLPAGSSRDYIYGPTLHNQINQPLSATDRSADMIWTPDFSVDWFRAFMFGNGIHFQYTRTEDGSVVDKDFTGQSVRDYYLDMSGGKYDIGGDVIGWVQVPHSTWYYDADECPGARSGASVSRGVIPGAGNARTLVRDALDAVEALRAAADPRVPADFAWSNYDKDGDGVIDRLWIVHAGLGEEDSTTLLNREDYGEAAVWSHSSQVTPAYEIGDSGISVGPYIVMPENGGIGVFAHEYGHNLGADDLYAYGDGETSAGFWTLMADDWTGDPVGFEPPSIDPWHLDRWGWLKPLTITDPSKVYEATIGQASEFPGTEGMVRGVKIELPDGQIPLPVAPLGTHYWYGGKMDVGNSSMTLKTPIAVPAGDATLSLDLAYGIEEDWDFLWVQASTDGGTTWNTLSNANTVCTHVEGWIGDLYGMDGACGFTGNNASFPGYNTEVFTLPAATYGGQNVLVKLWYMTDWGTTEEGPFIDNIVVKDAADATLFSDNAETNGDQWTYADDMVWSSGFSSFTQNYYLQFRNTTATGGYDSALGEPKWRYGPANSGLLVWYNNNNYTDNEVASYLTEYPGFGPKGRMLVVDANPGPYRSSEMVTAGYNNEGGNMDHRGQTRDATFGLNQGADFSWIGGWPFLLGPVTEAFTGRAAKSFFDDSLGYYPGARLVSRGPGYDPLSYKWVTEHWDASTVIPAQGFYGINASGYVGQGAGQQEFRYNCASTATGRLGCNWFGTATGLGYDGGTGNPGDYGVQYGWHVEVIEQNETSARVRIWNTNELNTFKTNKVTAALEEEITYSYAMKANPLEKMDLFTCADLDTTKVEYVSGEDILPLGMSCADVTSLALQGADLVTMQVPANVEAVAFMTNRLTRYETAGFKFTVKAKVAGDVSQDLSVYNNGVHHLRTAALEGSYDLMVSPAAVTMLAAPGETVTHKIAVTNLGAQADSFDIALSGNQWVTTGPVAVDSLAAGATTWIDVDVTVPAAANQNDSDRVTLTLTSQGNSEIAQSVALVTQANLAYGFTVAPTTAASDGTASVDVFYTLGITNAFNMADGFTVTKTGNVWATSVSTLPESLEPGASTNLVVRVTIPKAAKDGNQDTVAVTIASKGNPDFKRTVTLTTTSRNKYKLSVGAAVKSVVSPMGKLVTFEVTVTNEGNVEDSFAIGLEGDDWDVTVEGDTENILPEETRTILVKVLVPLGVSANAVETLQLKVSSDNDVTAISDPLDLTVTAAPLKTYLPSVSGAR